VLRRLGLLGLISLSDSFIERRTRMLSHGIRLNFGLGAEDGIDLGGWGV
jgi:hypothetical protein